MLAGNTYLGQGNILIGLHTGELMNADARNNVIIGINAGQKITAGDFNTFVGANAGVNNTASNNTFIGTASGLSTTSGDQNVGVGGSAMGVSTTGWHCTAIGFNSLASQQTSKGNTALGWQSGSQITVGAYNTCVGHNSGFTIVGQSGNTTLGESSDVGSSVSNSTSIGLQAKCGIANAMAFGRQATGSLQVTDYGFGVDPLNMGAGKCLQVGITGNAGQGAWLSDGGVWTDISNSNLKDNITKLDKQEILKATLTLDITKWKYSNTENEYHIGPMAQDFQRIYGIGDGTGIAAGDKAGIALLSVQALAEQIEVLNQTNETILEENAQLKEQLNVMNNALQNCCSNYTPTTPVSLATVQQNQPNPFNTKTRINYILPTKFSKAEIKVFNLNGEIIKSVQLQNSTTTVELEANTFAPGVYVYVLEIDGITIDSKQMIVTK